jgi:hypothetical protein
MVESAHGQLSVADPRRWLRVAGAWIGLPESEIPLVLVAVVISGALGSGIANGVLADIHSIGFPEQIPMSTLIAVWSVECTLYGLITAIGGLLLAIAPGPMDRKRLLQRFRRRTFDWVAVFGLSTILVTGLRVATLSPAGQAALVPLVAVAGIVLLFPLHIVAMGWLLLDGYRFVTRSVTPDEALRWLVSDIDLSIRRYMLSEVSLSVLNQRLFRNHPETDAVSNPKEGSKVIYASAVANFKHDVVSIHDVKLDQLQKCLDLDQSKALKQIGIAVGRRVHRSDALVTATPPFDVDRSDALVAATPFDVQLFQRKLKKCLMWDSSPVDEPFSTSIHLLRERGISAARNGNVYEYGLVIDALERLYVATLRARFEPVLALSQSRDQMSRLDHALARLPKRLVPAAWLRDAIQRIGEEALDGGSPNIVSRWLYAPQQFLAAARQYPKLPDSSPAYALMYGWIRAIDSIVSESARRPNDVAELLRLRLTAYGDLLARIASSRMHDEARLTDEICRYIETCAHAIPVIETRCPESLVGMIERFYVPLPAAMAHLLVFWFSYGCWLVQQACDCAGALDTSKDEDLLSAWTSTSRHFATCQQALNAYRDSLHAAQEWQARRDLLGLSGVEQEAYELPPPPTAVATNMYVALIALLLALRERHLLPASDVTRELAAALKDAPLATINRVPSNVIMAPSTSDTSWSEKRRNLVWDLWREHVRQMASVRIDAPNAAARMDVQLSILRGRHAGRDLGLSRETYGPVTLMAYVPKELANLPSSSSALANATWKELEERVRWIVDQMALAGIASGHEPQTFKSVEAIDDWVRQQFERMAGKQHSWSIWVSASAVPSPLGALANFDRVPDVTDRQRGTVHFTSAMNGQWILLLMREDDENSTKGVLPDVAAHYKVQIVDDSSVVGSRPASPLAFATGDAGLGLENIEGIRSILTAAKIDIVVAAAAPPIVHVLRLASAESNLIRRAPLTFLSMPAPWRDMSELLPREGSQ